MNREDFASPSFGVPTALLVLTIASNTSSEPVLGVSSLLGVCCARGHPSFTAERSSKDLSERDLKGLCSWCNKSGEYRKVVWNNVLLKPLRGLTRFVQKREKASRFPGCCCARR